MGTSLSGLTPATTFDGLLKTGDNEPIGSGLKTISDGSGNDSVLQLSDSELKVGGQFNVDTDTATTNIDLRGDGLNINQIYHANETTYNAISFLNSGGIRLKNNGSNVLVVRSSKVGIGTDNPDETLHVKGSGATSATTSLLVQNSAAEELLKVDDNGKLIVNGHENGSVSVEGTAGSSVITGNRNFTIQSNFGGYIRLLPSGSAGVSIGETTPTARLHVKGSGNDNTTTSLLVQNSDATELLKIYDDNSWSANGIGANSLGNIYTGSNRIFFRAANKVTYLGQFGTSGFQIGNSSADATAKLQIKGSGATSATTALLVQNSTGTERFKVRDDGLIFFGRPDSYMIGGNAFGGNWYFSGDNIFRGVLRNDTGSVKVNDDLYVGGNADNDTGVRLHVKGSGNDATTTALLVQNSDGTDMLSVKDDLSVVFNSTITSASSTLRFDVGGTGTIRMNSDKVAIGGNTTPAARLQVKGSGATSATTALLVENSAGTEHFKTNDDGVTTITSASQSVPLYVNASGSGTAGIELRSTSSRRFRILATSSITTLEATNTGGITTNSSLNVGGGSAADASAVLQADSTTKGFLPPRMTTAQKTAINAPAAGLMVYDTDTNTAECWNGSAWMPMF